MPRDTVNFRFELYIDERDLKINLEKLQFNLIQFLLTLDTRFVRKVSIFVLYVEK